MFSFHNSAYSYSMSSTEKTCLLSKTQKISPPEVLMFCDHMANMHSALKAVSTVTDC